MSRGIEEIIRDFCNKEGLMSAYAATRSGNFIEGLVPEGQHRDTFVAMTSIIHGGAETISMEMKVPLRHVTIHLADIDMLVITIGSKAILALTGKSIDDDMVAKAQILAKELEDLIP